MAMFFQVKPPSMLISHGARRWTVGGVGQFTPQPLLSGITRVTTMKMLGVTISDKLSVSDHVQNIVGSCAQSVHAIRTLRAHGMCQEDT